MSDIWARIEVGVAAPHCKAGDIIPANRRCLGSGGAAVFLEPPAARYRYPYPDIGNADDRCRSILRVAELPNLVAPSTIRPSRCCPLKAQAQIS